jgi:hypothetical protein
LSTVVGYFLDVPLGQVVPMFAHVYRTFIGAFLIEYMGRLLFGVSVTDLVYSIVRVTESGDKLFIVIDLFVNLFIFGFGTAPISWFITPEVFPVPIRSLAGSFVSVLNWLFTTGTMAGCGLLDESAKNWSWFVFTLFSIIAKLFG